MSKPTPDRVRPSVISLVVWGLIGLLTGVAVGGLNIRVHGVVGFQGKAVNVSVEVFGIPIRRGNGPESMDEVIHTWVVGLIAMFACAGACIGVFSRFVAHLLLQRAL